MAASSIPAFYNTATQSVPFGWIVVTVLTMTAGTVFLMWLGEQIDEYGIGNGISLLIMAGILSSMPGAIRTQIEQTSLELGGSPGKTGPEELLVLIFLFIAVVAGVVYITQAQRRIPRRARSTFVAGAYTAAATASTCRCW